MNKWLPKERRIPFFAVITVTVLVLVGIYFELVRTQHATLAGLISKRAAAEKQLSTIGSTIKNADADAKAFAQATNDLAAVESDIASGDLVFWSYDTMRRFKQNYKLEVNDVSRPVVADVDLMPVFPYQQLKFSVSGTGYYHEIGKFVSDFENQYPHARIVNLVIDAPVDQSTEKLSFRMQIICLVKKS